jgi:hypothetical protein
LRNILVSFYFILIISLTSTSIEPQVRDISDGKLGFRRQALTDGGEKNTWGRVRYAEVSAEETGDPL